jgi:O-antigen ligase/tetratricopeptide (TPR) repeat protein
VWYDIGHMKDTIRTIVLAGLFIIPAITLIVTDSMFFPYITGKNFTFRILVEILLGLWVILALLDATYRPKFSYILAAIGGFLAVMLLATLGAEHVPTALWSNYERMEGYVGILHVFGYFLVLSTVIRTEKQWSQYLHVSIIVAVIVSLFGLAQLQGNPGYRIDSRLGNSTYMAIYMLFHIFFIAYLFPRTKLLLVKFMYVIVATGFVYVLLQTGTRGTALGLATGIIAAVSYVALFGAKYPDLRRYASGAIIALVLGIGFFYLVKDSSYIQNSPQMARIANIDLEKDLEIRKIIWSMASEGISERPLLGWGMGNYNFVFNEHYDPRMYGQEQWFDRVHNIFFDWLIAGGVIGALAYFSIFAAVVYYLFVRQFFFEQTIFTVPESAVLLGLLVGYLTHNLVVFDNIVSYIFFAVLLAMIHSRVGTPITKIQSYPAVTPTVALNVVFPVVAAVTIAVVYVVNIPSIMAARDIITALRVPDTELAERYDVFDRALTRGSFANQEIVEQFVQQAIVIARTPNVSEEIRARYVERAAREIQQLIVNKPGDARLYVFQASFYRSTNQIELAREAFAKARELSPRKQWNILQQGAIELTLGENERARDFFKEAFELDTNFHDAREYYIASLYLVNDFATAEALIAEGGDAFKEKLVASDFVISAMNTAGAHMAAADLLEQRLLANSDNAQGWASLAFLYYQAKDNEKAKDALIRGAAAVPTFARTATCISSNIDKGIDPGTPCTE